MSRNDVFGPQDGPAPDFLRNTYDKQYQNLITTDFGELRPCFIKDVLPGTSVHIDPMVAIRSHPIVFPINTRIKFYCHFFYGRNRILYKDFEDFIFNTRDGLTPPLLKLTSERAKRMISTNSLGDNLGVPSVYAFGDYDGQIEFSDYGFYAPRDTSVIPSLQWFKEYFSALYLRDLPIVQSSSTDVNANRRTYSSMGFRSAPLKFMLSSNKFVSHFTGDVPVLQPSLTWLVITNSDGKPFYWHQITFSVSQTDSGFDLVANYDPLMRVDLAKETRWMVESFETYRIYILDYKDVTSYGTNMYQISENPPLFDFTPSDALLPNPFEVKISATEKIDATDDRVVNQNKFVGDDPVIPLSSLPFRLYEFCCNYYYRNDQNNPYILDGVPQYNKFIPTDAGGWDTNEYLIHHRNWESDPFTSAVPSPQYGTAPLVGLTYSGGDTARVLTNVTDSDGNTKQLGITVGVAEDGTLSSVMQIDTGVPSGSLRRLMDGVDGIRLGMSINDLRNVNSFQRFLENVIRRGLRYRNQLLSHFGVSVDYPDIDIPQFIGGFSGDLTVMEVTSMSESADVALGDVAGKINAVIKSNHTISCYCPEHGWIIGIFSIVPVPTYSQILPTYFTRYSYLDYFQKEFDKIGYVPIFHRNFLPLQSDDPNKILGYQRAWWDYMCSVDEVHGDFRTSLSDFVLYRQFKDVPTLNESFLQVDNDSLNNIFAVDKVDEKYKNSKKFMCQFYFEFPEKNMVSKFGVASLE